MALPQQLPEQLTRHIQDQHPCRAFDERWAQHPCARNAANLPADDEEAIALLTQVKGIGRWSAEIYLLFAEGRPDIWPAGDLAVQEAVKRILALPERPAEKAARALAEPWRPHRGAIAILSWHCYNIEAI